MQNLRCMLKPMAQNTTLQDIIYFKIRSSRRTIFNFSKLLKCSQTYLVTCCTSCISVQLQVQELSCLCLTWLLCSFLSNFYGVFLNTSRNILSPNDSFNPLLVSPKVLLHRTSYLDEVYTVIYIYIYSYTSISTRAFVRNCSSFVKILMDFSHLFTTNVWVFKLKEYLIFISEASSIRRTRNFKTKSQDNSVWFFHINLTYIPFTFSSSFVIPCIFHLFIQWNLFQPIFAVSTWIRLFNINS